MALGPLPAEAQHLPLIFTQGPLPSDRVKKVKVYLLVITAFSNLPQETQSRKVKKTLWI